MQEIPRKGGLRLKLVLLLLISGLVPLALTGYLTTMEMNQAADVVQDRMANLSTAALNRSALALATTEDTDQVQLAVAKAGQYDGIFKRIEAQGVLVANSYSYPFESNGSLDSAFGIWSAPLGGNLTAAGKASIPPEQRIPATILRSVVDQAGLVDVGYIGTNQGILVSWPNADHDLSKIRPYDPRDQTFYKEAKSAGKTIWTGPHPNVSGGSLAITCATPIYAGEELLAVVGMDISLWAMSGDLSGMQGRGYPFIIDRSGSIIVRPRTNPESVPWTELLAEGGPSDMGNPELLRVLKNMTGGKVGASVVGLSRGDCYISYAPIATTGWSLGIAFPSEKMQIPASYIEAGVEEVTGKATYELNVASARIGFMQILSLIFTGIMLIVAGVLLGGKISLKFTQLTDSVSRLGKGNLDVRFDESLPDEMGALSQALNRMERDLRGLAAPQEKNQTAAAGGEISEELRRRMAQSRLPQPEDYQVALFTLPGQEGFDFSEITDLGDGQLSIEIADVAGDRVRASILATLSKAVIRALVRSYEEPSLALQEANMEIGQSAARGMPVACFLGILNRHRGIVEYVNAGHNPPFIVSLEGTVETLVGGGMALGIMDQINLITEEREIIPGDVLVLYSDGVTEAANGSKAKFGTERLITSIREARDHSAQEIMEAVEAEIKAYSGGRPLKGDATVMIVKRLA